jgi:hypothetical protein
VEEGVVAKGAHGGRALALDDEEYQIFRIIVEVPKQVKDAEELQ